MLVRGQCIVLRRRPEGAVQRSDFESRSCEVQTVPEGTLLLENTHLAIDPAIRQWIGGRGRYIVPIEPNDTVRSVVLGRVVESRLPGYSPGDWVRALGGWETHSLVGPRDFPFRIADGDVPPPTEHLGVLGSAGLAAYFGLFEVGHPHTEETVLVSSAGGAVGSIVCQLARNAGCRVVAIAGSDTKLRWLRGVCPDCITINYRTAELSSVLNSACPKGVDVYFDNVGGALLEAALGRLRRGGRVVLCGATSMYDAPTAGGPANYLCLLEQGARMEGFMASHFSTRFDEAIAYLSQAIAHGRLFYHEEIVDGLEHAPEALRRVLSGEVMGRMVVRLASP